MDGREPAAATPHPHPASLASIADTANDVAIIGMQVRVPGAPDLAKFWANLRDGVESITFFSRDELAREAADDPAVLARPEYVPAMPVLDGIELFDAGFFGISPREAEIMDPQLRIFLECCWEALEIAGYDSGRYPGAIGVFAGAKISYYLMMNLFTNPEVVRSTDRAVTVLNTFNDKDSLATLVSYKMNLRGPSLAVQSFCSTSLVAIHLACQSLLNGECNMALAGGVSLTLPQRAGYLYQEGGVLSPEGRCFAFDSRAKGTIFGNGAGVVVLKPLAQALADGDSIRAVIKGSAINNDGSLKAGFMAPSAIGQARAIAEALAVAQVHPDTIAYVEAHGAGTALGDPIEVQALARAFREHTDRRGFCALGSVKTNVGHLDRAAGVTGVIKTVLALEHQEIPPSLHYERPNPQIDFAASPFFVNTELRSWPAGRGPRRAAVNAQGVGGTNAHLILEEAPPAVPSGPSRPWQLLLWSARSAAALKTATGNLAGHLDTLPADSTDTDDISGIADIAYTLAVGRHTFAHRAMLVCRDRADAAEALRGSPSARVSTHRPDFEARPVVFMFPGGGAQYPGMGAELYREEPVYRQAIERCLEILAPRLGFDLRSLLYPAAEHLAEATERFRQTSVALPALFATEYALAQLLMSLGIQPQALIGHSLGEYVAACLAGVLSLADALALVVLRGQLFEELPEGAMLSVALTEEQVKPLLGGQLSLAAINGPELCVLSGPVEEILETQRRLVEQGCDTHLVPIAVAAHSSMVEPLLDRLAELVHSLRLHPPRIPWVSNTTGTWMTEKDAVDPDYWVRHLRQTVRFADGLRELVAQPQQILLEVGPGRTLATLARQHGDRSPEQSVLVSLRHPQDEGADQAFLLSTVGRLWLEGVDIDWAAYWSGERRRRVALPTYPFERQRYWIERRPAGDLLRPREGKKPDVADWFYIPSFQLSLPPGPLLGGAAPRRALLFADRLQVVDGLAERLRAAGWEILLVRRGAAFARLAPAEYELDPEQPGHYARLVSDLLATGLPQVIVHGFSLTGPSASGPRAFRELQPLGYLSLLFLVQALQAAGGLDSFRPEAPLEIRVLSDHLHAVASGEVRCPEKATLLAPVKVLPQEIPTLACQAIDIAFEPVGGVGGVAGPAGELIDRLAAEIASPLRDSVIAHRGRQRWVQTFVPVRLDGTTAPVRSLRENGVYLLTGGLGGVGLLLAEHLAARYRARLVLLGRSGLPPREEWDAAAAGDYRIRRLRRLEELGAEVLVVQADVADPVRMREVVEATLARFGTLHGVLHAAGQIGEELFRVLEHTDTVVSEGQFQAKVYGTYALEEALRGRPLDFCLLFSSNASVLGGIGFTAYAAANLFLDAFARDREERSGAPWVSSNWDGWPLAEITGEVGVETSMKKYAMDRAESLVAFERVVAAASYGQIVVSTGDLAVRLERWIDRQDSSGEPGSTAGDAAAHHPRPSLRNDYVEPRSDIERTLAEIWQSLLGIEQIGVYDNFFELGGHSLMATRLFSRLREVYPAELSLQRMFQALRTIADLAQYVESTLGAEDRDLAEIAGTLELVEGMSLDEVRRLLDAQL
jgi:phthiocerol/phenolphthiocerol synthesis type-I polyketide synthase E